MGKGGHASKHIHAHRRNDLHACMCSHACTLVCRGGVKCLSVFVVHGGDEHSNGETQCVGGFMRHWGVFMVHSGGEHGGGKT